MRFLDIKAPAHPEALTDVTGLFERLERAFGDEQLAHLLGVAPAAVAEYMTEKHVMGDEMKQRVIDLHDVFNRVFQVLMPDTAMRWLVGSEPFLGGRRPVDLLASGGVAQLINAINNISAGGYA